MKNCFRYRRLVLGGEELFSATKNCFQHGRIVLGGVKNSSWRRRKILGGEEKFLAAKKSSLLPWYPSPIDQSYWRIGVKCAPNDWSGRIDFFPFCRGTWGKRFNLTSSYSHQPQENARHVLYYISWYAFEKFLLKITWTVSESGNRKVFRHYVKSSLCRSCKMPNGNKRQFFMRHTEFQYIFYENRFLSERKPVM